MERRLAPDRRHAK
jgi:hypothetical protein